MTLVLLFLACGLAFANGANDNCKGVAALVSAGEATPARALGWAAATTALGSLIAFSWGGGLVELFRAGFVDGGTSLPPVFFAAVLAGAIGWVLLATATGMPVSTTHAIIGALVGAGLVAVGAGRIGWAVVATRFALPLLLGPLIALAVVFLLARPISRLSRRAAGRCACLMQQPALAAAMQEANGSSDGGASATGRWSLTTGHLEDCALRSPVAVVEASRLVRAANWLTSGLVGFARAWNDTPKIAALALVAMPAGGSARLPFLLVTAAMALGGLVSGRRVLRTLSARVTRLPVGESLAASTASAALVGLASFHGLPLSTTHVTTGAIVGAGLARDRRSVHLRVVRDIVLAWIVTLPAGAILAFVALSLI
ncbi:MAG: inorganic phosphate transporter [Thermoanaerobaculia bacterium]